ncbi:MAG: COX15/CtaA family protein [Alphaproteobacteria bacterium]|nr:COX15/CtaA family protein [Alphaproteobacteria bacterium SS10]
MSDAGTAALDGSQQIDSAEIDDRDKARRAIAIWLWASAGMVFAMAIIGAITRLTESGLSMTEWRPLIGAIPPLNEAEWQRVFDLYRATPEYQFKNAGMGLDQFKLIFFWEWFHRLWGRLIGVVYALPFFWFLFRRQIPLGFHGRLWILLVLGGLQGVIGMFMVMSGLVDRPSVSHYRLALHLGMATFIFAMLVVTAIQIVRPAGQSLSTASRGLITHGWLGLAMVSVTIVWGAFVAGLDAGLFYNTFPLMNGAWLPSELFDVRPLWFGLVDNPALVQFTHRYLAIATAIVLAAFSLRAWRQTALPMPIRVLGAGVGGMALFQTLLGIATLLSQVWIPLAAVHQAGALILLALLTAFMWSVRGEAKSAATA